MNGKSSFDYLKLQGAQVMSVEISGKLMNCVVIPVDYNGITDVTLLNGCLDMINLSIASNEIYDISQLFTLTNLEIFDFDIELEDIYRLMTMPETGWSGQHPEHF